MQLGKLKIPKQVLDELPDVMAKFSINTPLRLAHFLAQCGHESGGFTVYKENLNYSAEGLNKIFKKYFPTIESTNGYAKNPEKIANKVYASRMGNGDEASGDGYRYSGRGAIQLTGRSNYSLFNNFVEEDTISTPSIVATKYPILSAAWFFQTNGLNAIADTGATDEVVTKITKRVNGGVLGLESRIKHFKEYYSQLL